MLGFTILSEVDGTVILFCSPAKTISKRMGGKVLLVTFKLKWKLELFPNLVRHSCLWIDYWPRVGTKA